MKTARRPFDRTSQVVVVTTATLLLVSGLPVLFPGLPSPFAPLAGPLESAMAELLPAFGGATPGAVDQGPLPPTPITVGLAMPAQNPAVSAELIQALYTPGSPAYRHFLTPAQYESLFSPTPGQASAVERYYGGFGLTVTPSADRLMFSISGSSTRVGAAFHTSFDKYRLADGTIVYGTSSPVFVPQGLGASALTGFTNRMGIQPFYTAPPKPVPKAPSSSVPAACSPVSGNPPSQLEGQYNETPILSTYNGAGITVGIVDAYDAAFSQSAAQSDLTSFASGCGLPTPHMNFLYPVRTTGNLNQSYSGWGGETQLDIETVDSMAPGATIDLTFASDSSLAVYEAVDFLVANNVTQTISMSWGEPDQGSMAAFPPPCVYFYSCNASWDSSYAFLHPVFAEAVAEGISPFAATGDCGAYDGTSILTTDYPASDEYVTGVGGTLFNTTGTTYGGEVGSNGNGMNCGGNAAGDGGGGFAPWGRPFWQYGPGIPSTPAQRALPDVAAVSQDGTSEATPVWAGLIAVGDQMHGGTGLGLLGPSLYSVLRSSKYTHDFHDILVGNNGYAAGRDWDADSGMGSPNIANLLPDLFRYQPPAVSSGMSATLKATPGSGASETFTATVTGGTAPYSYDFVPALYHSQWSTQGTLAYTYTGTGAQFAIVEIWDAHGNWTQSLPILVQVSGTPLTVSLVPSVTSVQVGSPVSFTTTVSGGAAPYVYTYLWGDGSYGYNDSATDSHAYMAPGTYCPSVEVVDSASTSDGGVGTSSCIQVVAGAAKLHAAFTATPTSGTPWLHVNFTSAASGGAGGYTYLWSFGDGSSTSTAANPSHVYTTWGRFQVNLTVTDSATAVAHAFGNVSVAPPTLSVTLAATPTSGKVPLSVAFSAGLQGGTSPYTYLWNYGDLSPTSGAPSPSHTYNATGTYMVVLTVSDLAAQTAHAYTNITVSAYPTLVASIVASPSTGIEPLAVTFSSSIGGGLAPYTYAWDFGDGGSSTLADPTHTYSTTGTMQVILTVTDQQPVSRVAFLNVTVNPAPLTASSSALPLLGTAPLTVTFNGTPAGGIAPYLWTWTFGDTSVGSHARNPTHVYNASGSYQAQLSVTDAQGALARASAMTITVNPYTVTVTPTGPSGPIAVGAPASFSASATGGVAPYTYIWTFGDGATGTGSSVSHTYATVGTYTVSVQARDRASVPSAAVSLTVSVTTLQPLTVQIGGLSSSTVGSPASFWAAASGGAGGYTFSWSFGDGAVLSTGTTNSTAHVYTSVGTFEVWVTVTDSIAKSVTSTTHTIRVSATGAPGTGGSGGSLTANGSLTLLGWVVVALIAGAVFGALLFVVRRRSRGGPPGSGAEPGPGAAPYPPGPSGYSSGGYGQPYGSPGGGPPGPE